MTYWEEIELRATTYIKNDISLDRDKAERLPVFFNRMAAYMTEAIVIFDRPPEMLAKLGNYTAPQYDSVTYTVEETTTGDFNIETEMYNAGVVAVGVLGTDEYGDPTYTPITTYSYYPEVGIFTIYGDDGEYPAGTQILLDFYWRGSFAADLNATEQGILAFAIYNRYEHRFDNDVLERQSKIRDSAFTTISEASQTQAGTARQREVDSQLFGMMRAYQDNCEYLRLLNGGL